MSCTTLKHSKNSISEDHGVDIKKQNPFMAENEIDKWSQDPPPYFPHYSTYKERLKSYDSWNEQLSLKPELLSEAGFFYLGPKDRTVCFHCSGGLNEWNTYDDPWVEHAYWFPRCSYVAAVRGKQFVDNAVGKKQETVQLQEVKNVTDALREIVDIVKSRKKNKVTPPKMEKIVPKTTSSTPVDKSSGSESSMLCKICFLEERNTLFIPCRHILACVNCSSCLSKCPVCRQHIQESIRVYPS